MTVNRSIAYTKLESVAIFFLQLYPIELAAGQKVIYKRIKTDTVLVRSMHPFMKKKKDCARENLDIKHHGLFHIARQI